MAEARSDELTSEGVPKRTLVAAGALSLTQLILTFLLGFFGNKAAELVQLEPVYVYLAIGALLILLLAIQLYVTHGKDLTDIARRARQPSRLLTLATGWDVLPFAVLFGFGIQLVAILLVPGSDLVVRFPIVSADAHAYELLAGVGVIVSLFVFRALWTDRSLMLAYCIGAGVGIATTGIVLDPLDNNPAVSYVGWLAGMLAVALIASSSLVRNYVLAKVAQLTGKSV